MTEESVHQALFGYARGHRMLTASRPIPAQASQVLRAATDTAVERDDGRYLTVLPLPDLRAQAFIRTWRGEGWLRPGSVWSHVLLVDFVALANIDSFRGITALFRRPHLEPDRVEPDVEPYKHPLVLEHALVGPGGSGAVDLILARQIVGAIYGTDGRVVVGVDDAAAAEATLLAIYEQQWPRLRRHFAFRTRLRSSEGTTPYDLDVIERAKPVPDILHTTDWAARLVDDLVAGDATDLRGFLRAFGSGTANGRRAMPGLVMVHSSLVHADASATVDVLCRAFPRPRQMRGLKAALLGVPDHRAWAAPDWPHTDPERLVLLFTAPSGTVDYDELQVGARIAAAIKSSPAAVADVLHRLDLERLPPTHVQTVVEAVVEAADDEMAAAIAAEQPDLGVLLVAHRPLLLARTGVWNTLDVDLLVEVYDRAGAEQQRSTLRALLDAAAEEPLITLCSSDPTRWWQMLLVAARPGVDAGSLAAEGKLLRRVLERVGAAAIGAPVTEPQTHEQLLALLVSAELSTGVWRHAPPRAWVDLWLGTDTDGLPRALRDRLATVALLSATSSGGQSMRIEAWRETFQHLHKSLADSAFDEEAWRALAGALPAAPEWDRCLRLRRGALSEIRRDRWPAEDTARLLAASGRYRDEMLGELQASPARKKGKHWLRKLMKSLLP